jgi:RimJ/RimL family protein N-acetyltransferase
VSTGLTGEQVRLAPLSEGDLEALFEWINDRELVLHSSAYSPVHEADHRAWFDAIRSRDDVVIFGVRAISDDRLIGACQLLAIDYRHGTADLQIRIGDESARGRGWGTEAVRLLLDHAFRDLNLHRVQLQVFASNARAIQAYEKAGFRSEGVLREGAFLDGSRADIVVMGVLSSEHLGEDA